MRTVAVLIATLGMSSTVMGQSPDQIIADAALHRDRMKAVRAELTVKIVQSATINEKTRKAEPIPPVTINRKISAVVDFTTGRYRWSYDGDEYDFKSKSLVPYRASIAYDGNVLRSVVYPRSGPTDALPGTARRSDFAEVAGELQEQEFPPNERPLYIGLGVLPAGGRRPLFPGGFHTYDVRKHADTFFPTVNSPTAPAGIWLTTVQTGPSAGDSANRYCFDSKLGSAVIHWQTVKKSVPYYSASLNYRLKGDRAVLAGWTFDDLFNGVKMTTFTYTVSDIDYEYAPADSDFALKPEFGMVASKIAYGPADGGKTMAPAVGVFRVAEDGELIPLGGRLGWGARNRPIFIWAACAVISLAAIRRIHRLLTTSS